MAFKNKLLQRFSAADRAALWPHLELVALKSREVLVKPGARITHVYFPESGLLAVHAKCGPDAIEVGMIGFEGMSDMIAVSRTPLETLVHVPGEAYRIPHDLLAKQAKESADLAELFFRYHQYLNIQVSYTALAHGSFKVEERLARWLLMAHDRLQGSIPITHDLFAWILAVRRAGVSQATQILEDMGCIKKRRGQLMIEDREKLESISGGCYGLAEREYRALVESYEPTA